MKVVRAEHAGACYGVQRAIDLSLGAAQERGAAFTIGPLIHNPKAVEDLRAHGVYEVNDLGEAEDGALIIRSHGVTPEVFDAVAATGLPVVDATCPHVARAQRGAAELARKGCRVIVVGEEGHPEVEGLKAHALREGAKVDVVPGPDAVPGDLRPPIGIVVQTTQRRENLEAVVQRVLEQGIEPEVKRTICFATRQRQDAAAELAGQVDAMVVIGGRNSSNTTRLAEICADTCARTVHVESADELEGSFFEGCSVVGVTAGASTPEEQIRSVVAYLEAL